MAHPTRMEPSPSTSTASAQSEEALSSEQQLELSKIEVWLTNYGFPVTNIAEHFKDPINFVALLNKVYSNSINSLQLLPQNEYDFLIINWILVNREVLQSLGLRQRKSTIESLAKGEPDSVYYLLSEVMRVDTYVWSEDADNDDNNIIYNNEVNNNNHMINDMVLNNNNNNNMINVYDHNMYSNIYNNIYDNNYDDLISLSSSDNGHIIHREFDFDTENDNDNYNAEQPREDSDEDSNTENVSNDYQDVSAHGNTNHNVKNIHNEYGINNCMVTDVREIDDHNQQEHQQEPPQEPQQEQGLQEQQHQQELLIKSQYEQCRQQIRMQLNQYFEQHHHQRQQQQQQYNHEGQPYQEVRQNNICFHQLHLPQYNQQYLQHLRQHEPRTPSYHEQSSQEHQQINHDAIFEADRAIHENFSENTKSINLQNSAQIQTIQIELRECRKELMKIAEQQNTMNNKLKALMDKLGMFSTDNNDQAINNTNGNNNSMDPNEGRPLDDTAGSLVRDHSNFIIGEVPSTSAAAARKCATNTRSSCSTATVNYTTATVTTSNATAEGRYNAIITGTKNSSVGKTVGKSDASTMTVNDVTIENKGNAIIMPTYEASVKIYKSESVEASTTLIKDAVIAVVVNGNTVAVKDTVADDDAVQNNDAANMTHSNNSETTSAAAEPFAFKAFKLTQGSLSVAASRNFANDTAPSSFCDISAAEELSTVALSTATLPTGDATQTFSLGVSDTTACSSTLFSKTSSATELSTLVGFPSDDGSSVFVCAEENNIDCLFSKNMQMVNGKTTITHCDGETDN